MKIISVLTIMGSLLLCPSASAAEKKLDCVKVWDDNAAIGGRAHARNECAGPAEFKFVINNDTDCPYRKAGKDVKLSCPYGSPFAGLEKVLIKYKGKEYVNR
ncbi:hypothetical protein NLX83_30450 [Allokutzneria sp. A3M-2-11 16]|uniref:hypothetical protein n=1 Tax=Allokutzneria sp. A3M-2-11 16 TaxID=2962043 RepID=UPI0020B6E838|nr:hypothetical protein [Allokutzneria sp. A3M-2-11 16]MCP3803601.1 hypothetical protein [Allokutzneria sp. A3M-2-11 16]